MEEVILQFDPGDPNLTADEFYAAMNQAIRLLPECNLDQVEWLLALAKMARIRYDHIARVCELELARRPRVLPAPRRDVNREATDRPSEN